MLPTSWRRLLSLIRILLGMSCLATQLISSSLVWTETAILFALYIIYGCVALFWRGLEDSGFPTLALIVDFVFFFIAAFSAGAYGYWISSVFYAYVLLAAVMLHPWWKTVAGGGGGHRTVVRGADLAFGRDAAARVHRGGYPGQRARHTARVSGGAAFEQLAPDGAVPL